MLHAIARQREFPGWPTVVSLERTTAPHSDLACAVIRDYGRKYRSTIMDIPFVIAILALLAFVLLPVLDRFASSEINATGLRAYWIRIARWVNE